MYIVLFKCTNNRCKVNSFWDIFNTQSLMSLKLNCVFLQLVHLPNLSSTDHHALNTETEFYRRRNLGFRVQQSWIPIQLSFASWGSWALLNLSIPPFIHLKRK